MQKIAVLAALFVLLAGPLAAQRFFTRDAKVYFDGTAASSPEKIEATTKSGTCVLDSKTGQMEWKVLVKGFQMEKALMQEHFNENYLESSKFPNAQFKGTITNLSEINFAQEGKYSTKVKGQLTMHGVTKDVDVTGTVKVNKGTVTVASSFNLLAADYGISIPSLVADKLAKVIKISVEAVLQPMK